MASMLTKRYAPTLGPSTTDALTRQAADLSRRYSTGAAHIAGLQRANRSPGALVLKA
jgi:hypothetical protein